MLILIAVLLVLIPAVAIVYPFVRGRYASYAPEDEAAPAVELSRRLEETLAALRNAELERTLGNLPEDDYRSLRESYMTEAALLMKALDVEEKEEQRLLASIETDIRQARLQASGAGDGASQSTAAHETQGE